MYLRERSALFVLLKGLLTNPIERHFNYLKVLYDGEINLIEFKKNVREISDFMEKNNLKHEYILLPYAHQIIIIVKKNS